MELHRSGCDRCWPSAPVLRHARGRQGLRRTSCSTCLWCPFLAVAAAAGEEQGTCGHVKWTSSCDHAATSSAALLRSWVVPQLQFIDRVDSVRDGVLLVLPSVVHRDRYPQCFPFGRVRGVAVH